MSRPALVVGGNGGIGAAAAEALRSSDWQVVAVGRRDHTWPGRPAFVVNAAGAGMSSTNRSVVAELNESNVLVAERAGRLALDAGCRLIHLGTPLSRTQAFGDGDPYAVTKTQASERLWGMPGLDLIELRPHLVVGTPDCLVTRIARSLGEQAAFELRTPDAERDLVHVSDVARAVLLAATVKALPDQPIEIGTGEAIAMKDLVSLVADLLGSSVAWTSDPEARPSTRDARLVAPVGPARQELGFTTSLSIPEAIRRCVHDRAELGSR